VMGVADGKSNVRTSRQFLSFIDDTIGNTSRFNIYVKSLF
jgi:hypothetical protein